MNERAPPVSSDLAGRHNRILESDSPPPPPARDQFTARSATDRNRRIISLLVASMGLILIAPLMVVLSALVLLTSGRPIIYSQPRIGIDRRYARGQAIRGRNRHVNLGGRPFAIYKFRTMRGETTVSIDVTRLLIRWAMVVVLVGGLVFTLGERRIT